MVILNTALVGVSEEVRSRCHVKHSLPRYMSESISQENFITENLTSNAQATSVPVNSGVISTSTTSGVNRRQKSWDLLDQSALAQARQHKQLPPHQVSENLKYLLFQSVM